MADVEEQETEPTEEQPEEQPEPEKDQESVTEALEVEHDESEEEGTTMEFTEEEHDEPEFVLLDDLEEKPKVEEEKKDQDKKMEIKEKGGKKGKGKKGKGKKGDQPEPEGEPELKKRKKPKKEEKKEKSKTELPEEEPAEAKPDQSVIKQKSSMKQASSHVVEGEVPPAPSVQIVEKKDKKGDKKKRKKDQIKTTEAASIASLSSGEAKSRSRILKQKSSAIEAAVSKAKVGRVSTKRLSTIESSESMLELPSEEQVRKTKSTVVGKAISEKVVKKGKGKKEKKGKKVKSLEKLDESGRPSEELYSKTPSKELYTKSPSKEDHEIKEAKAHEPKEPKEKGKKGKKPKKNLTAEMVEKMRQEQEQAAVEAAAEERRLRLEELARGEELEKRERFENQNRIEQFEYYEKMKAEIYEHNDRIQNEKDKLEEWEIYLECRILPDGTTCQELTTYLHNWKEDIELTTVENCIKRTKDIMQILLNLENALVTFKKDVRRIDNLKWVRQLLRDCQAKSLDETTYRLLRFEDTEMNRVDMYVSEYKFQDDSINFSLWLRKQLPIPLPNPRRPPRPRIDINFSTLDMTVLCPSSLDDEGLAIRVLYHIYDHFSDLSESYNMPPVPDILHKRFIDYVRMMWNLKMKYKWEHRIKKMRRVEGPDGEIVEEIEEDEEEPPPEGPFPYVPYRKLDPTPQHHVLMIENELYETTRRNMYRNLPEHVVNLRQYIVIGGVWKVNLLKQPPQPQEFILIDMHTTRLFLPKQLEHLPFYIDYEPPPPIEPGVIRTPEEIEEDLKKQEEQMDKLILISLKWPDHVLFLDLPIVCFWDEELKAWTRNCVFDLKHVEESGVLSFRTQRFGTFALATLRYSHLPFQAWELRPEEDGTCTLQITSAVLIFEFNVKDDMICLSQLQNCPKNVMKNQIGQYYTLPYLMRVMKDSGIDIFPSFDAFCYVEGVCEKHWHTERHLYKNMAQMHNSFMFSWSRWNVTLERRNIVFQMREYVPNRQKQRSYSMTLVTPDKATFIDCTEVSQTFEDKEIEGMKYCCDLYQLMRSSTSIMIRTQVASANKQSIFVLENLLQATRIFSFS